MTRLLDGCCKHGATLDSWCEECLGPKPQTKLSKPRVVRKGPDRINLAIVKQPITTLHPTVARILETTVAMERAKYVARKAHQRILRKADGNVSEVLRFLREEIKRFEEGVER